MRSGIRPKISQRNDGIYLFEKKDAVGSIGLKENWEVSDLMHFY